GHDQAVGVAHAERREVEAGDADHRHAQRLGQRLGRGDADAEPGEQARPDVDGDGTQVVELDQRLTAYEVDRWREGLGMALAARRVERGQYTLVAADGAPDLGGR